MTPHSHPAVLPGRIAAESSPSGDDCAGVERPNVPPAHFYPKVTE